MERNATLEMGRVLNAALAPRTDMSQWTLIEVMDYYQNRTRIKSPRYSNQTVINSIAGLESQYNTKIKPIQITSEFLDVYTNYLLENYKLKPNSIENYISKITCSLNMAKEYGCQVDSSFRDHKKEVYTPHTICLSLRQISHIYHFDISTLKDRFRPQKLRSLEAVRDMFCLACCFGQRYSDMKRITPSMFDATKTTIRLSMQKTGGKAKVDIHKYAVDKDMAYAILEKYDYYAPYTANNNNFNRHLHDLLKAIGGEFNELVHYEYKVNGRIVSYDRPLYEVIASHAARRSFVTYNRLERNISREDVMVCTGHKSDAMIATYECRNDE